MKNLRKTPLVLTLGTSLLSTLATTVHAESNTDFFALTELSRGYMQLAEETPAEELNTKTQEAKCGEDKANMEAQTKAAEGKCGDKKMPETSKSPEGATDKAAEGKCGDKNMGDAKASEGKCGGKKARKSKHRTKKVKN